MAHRIESRVVPSVRPVEIGPSRIDREFRRELREGAELLPVGSARRDPESLLRRGYTPKYRIELFDTWYWLGNQRQNPDLRFFVAFVQSRTGAASRRIYPRLFYKDVSLVWRSASHYMRSEEENWIGKGDLKEVVENGEVLEVSDELTTDLPLEIQTALELLCRRVTKPRRDEVAVDLVLRHAPDERLEPYRDFSEPRRRAAADPRNRINAGRSIARFTRRNDPASLRFTPGFEPDFERGIVETGESSSRLYGGRLGRYRIVSRNRLAQYLFFHGPRHVWIGALQATTTELMSYGVRTIDVVADDDLLVPGYEYHFMDDSEDPPQLLTQIPKGFAGAASEHDPSRADASPWLDQLPVVKEFRRAVAHRERRGGTG